MLFGIIVCATLNTDKQEERRVVAENEDDITSKHGEGKRYNCISKQLHVPVATVSDIRKFNLKQKIKLNFLILATMVAWT